MTAPRDWWLLSRSAETRRRRAAARSALAHAHRVGPALAGRAAHRARQRAEMRLRVADRRAQMCRRRTGAIGACVAELADAELVAHVAGVTAERIERVDH